MVINVFYFAVIIGIGFIFVIIGFISGPKHYKKTIQITTIPTTGSIGVADPDSYYRLEKQNFLCELKDKYLEKKSNWSEDYRKEKEKRDVAAFSEFCNSGFFKDFKNGVSR